jgi:hypothetical protein
MKYVPIGILLAVEKRAQGFSWEVCAEAAGWKVEALHAWIGRHQALWYRELFRHRRDLRDLACDEAVSVLRTHIRSKEKQDVVRAAQSLASNFKTRPAGKPRAATPKDQAQQFRELLDAVPEGVTTRADLHLQASEAEDRAHAGNETADERFKR